MSSRAQTVRLSPSQYRVLADFAKRRGVSEYAMLARFVEAGFLAMLHGTDKEIDLAELAREIGAISARLSAPKSVSIMAEVAGDKRLIKAHGAAVKAALAHVEKHMAATRVRQGGEVRREATGNLAIATFRHATSRAQDPQLHTHGVILNATQDKDGSWRSLESRAFYQLQKEIGAIYRQELAHGVAALGYRIEAGKDSLFEIAGVPEKAIDALSQRTAAIDARLGAMARHYLTLSPSERARTLVIEPSREGRDKLTDMIRRKLTGRGELSAEAVRLDALEAKGLTRAEVREAASYAIGDVVRFSRDYAATLILIIAALNVSAGDLQLWYVTIPGSLRPRPVPLPEQEWLLPGRRVDQVVPCRDGSPARIVAPDPCWFALHKLWLGAQAKRNPLKRRKDTVQGAALLDAVAEAMPHYSLDHEFVESLPDELLPYWEEWAKARG